MVGKTMDEDNLDGIIEPLGYGIEEELDNLVWEDRACQQAAAMEKDFSHFAMQSMVVVMEVKTENRMKVLPIQG